MAYKDGFLSEEDLVDILSQIRAIITDYKQRNHEMSREDVVAYRDDLAILRVQLGDIEGDLFSDKLGAEVTYENFVYRQTEKYIQEYAALAKDPKSKVSYPEDKAKRRAKLAAEDLAEEMNQKKAMHRKAYVLVQHTLQDVLNAMSSRINLLATPMLTPTAPQAGARPVHDDPWAQWHSLPDTETKALDQIAELEDEI